jgi:hypothetical protein
MLTLIFLVLMFIVFGKIAFWAFKAAWGIAKVLVTMVILPLILIAMACAGLIYLSIVIVVICGIVTLIASVVS